TVNATFTIPAGCPAQQISLAVYLAHKDFVPLSTQKLFSSNSAMYGGGDYTITTTMPQLDCFYQVDLFRGPAPTQLGDNVNNPAVIAFTWGGNKDCINPAPTPPPTPPPAPTPTPVQPAAAVTPAPS